LTMRAHVDEAPRPGGSLGRTEKHVRADVVLMRLSSLIHAWTGRRTLRLTVLTKTIPEVAST